MSYCILITNFMPAFREKPLTKALRAMCGRDEVCRIGSLACIFFLRFAVSAVQQGESRVAGKNQKQTITRAVAAVLVRDGLLNTTIDAVAAEAGISKGGVLYYFPSKRDLLDSLIFEYERQLLEARDELAATLPDTPNRNFKATVLIMLRDMVGQGHQPNFLSTMSDEGIRHLVGEVKRRIYDDAISNGLPATKVAMILYLLDGLFMDVVFDPMVIPEPQRREIIDMVKNMVETIGDESAA